MNNKLTIFQRKYLIKRIKDRGEALECHPNFTNILCDSIVLAESLTHGEFERMLASVDDYVEVNGKVE